MGSDKSVATSFISRTQHYVAVMSRRIIIIINSPLVTYGSCCCFCCWVCDLGAMQFHQTAGHKIITSYHLTPVTQSTKKCSTEEIYNITVDPKI